MLRRKKLLNIYFNIRLKVNFLFFQFNSIFREIKKKIIFRARFFVLLNTINLSIIILIVVIITIRAIVSFFSRVFTISLSVITNVFLLLFLIFIRILIKIIKNETWFIIAITSATISIFIKIENIEIEKYVITSSLRTIVFFFKKSIFFSRSF